MIAYAGLLIDKLVNFKQNSITESSDIFEKNITLEELNFIPAVQFMNVTDGKILNLKTISNLIRMEYSSTVITYDLSDPLNPKTIPSIKTYDVELCKNSTAFIKDELIYKTESVFD